MTKYQYNTENKDLPFFFDIEHGLSLDITKHKNQVLLVPSVSADTVLESEERIGFNPLSLKSLSINKIEDGQSEHPLFEILLWTHDNEILNLHVNKPGLTFLQQHLAVSEEGILSADPDCFYETSTWIKNPYDPLEITGVVQLRNARFLKRIMYLALIPFFLLQLAIDFAPGLQWVREHSFLQSFFTVIPISTVLYVALLRPVSAVLDKKEQWAAKFIKRNFLIFELAPEYKKGVFTPHKK